MRYAGQMELAQGSDRSEEEQPAFFPRLLLGVGAVISIAGLVAGAAAFAGLGLNKGSLPVLLSGNMDIAIWQSAYGTDDKLTQKPHLQFQTEDFQFDGPVVSITDTSGQVIKGFGGAFTEAAGLVFKNLTDSQREQFLEDYFGPSGNGYTLGRTHINSCDFSVGNYAFDDVENDMDLKHFDDGVTRDTKALIPLIHAAQAKLKQQSKSLSLLASPWSPPAWMKDQSWNVNRSTMDHSGSPCLKPGMAPVWAKYFTKWIHAYKAHDIPIWAITVQNEPENNATWEACLMNPWEEADFVGNHLGPELKASHPDVDIFVFDHNKDHVYDWAKTIFEHPQASKYATGVAYHWYAGDGFENLKKVQTDFPQATQLASEATWEAYRWKKGTTLATGDWSFGEGYARDIIGDLNTGSIGWIDWNLILNEIGGPNHVDNVCDAAMQVNFSLSPPRVYRHPQYYYIGHFSRFILPGSKHLLTNVQGSHEYQGAVRPYGKCTGDDGLQATAAKRPDGKVVVVALNCGDEHQDFKMTYGSRAVKLSLPAHGVQTYLFEGNAPGQVVV